MNRQKRGPMDYMQWSMVPQEQDWAKYKSWMLAWLDRKAVIGDRWCYVKREWLGRYVEWLESDKKKPEPGPVEIKRTIRPDLLTKEDLKDHKALLSCIWDHLKERFTGKDKPQPIRRNTVNSINNEPVVEDSLVMVSLVHHSNLEDIKPWGISRLDRFYELETHLRSCFDITRPTPVRISHLWSPEEDMWEVMRYKMDRLDTVYNHWDPQSVVFLVETPDPHTGDWPRTKHTMDSKGGVLCPTAKHIATTFDVVGSYRTKKTVTGGHTAEHMYRGLTGFDNHENNCYMSAIIQPLAALPSVRDYFLTDTHLAELNPKNPIGRGGKFAKMFGDLVKHLWSGKYNDIKPVYFKREMAVHKEEYVGYDMHDAHEFLLYLLDGLHEDCNRVTSKPYVTLSDTPGRPEAELAAEAWSAFKQRNDSVFVDMFYGMTRTCVTCPQCHQASTTFEPTPCLSLSIPSKRVLLRFCFRPCDPTKPLLILRLSLHMAMRLSEVKERISAQVGVPATRVSVGTIHTNKYWVETRENTEALKALVSSHTLHIQHALEVPECRVEMVRVLVNLSNTPALNTSRGMNAWHWDDLSLYVMPFYVVVPKDATYDQLYEAVLKYLVATGLKVPKEEDRWWEWQFPKDEDYLKQVADFYSERHTCVLPMPDLNKTQNNWERNGKHYIFRLTQSHTPLVHPCNDDKPLAFLKEGTHLVVEFHTLYCRDYLNDIITDMPQVKVLKSYSLQVNHRPVFELTDCLDTFHRTQNFHHYDSWVCSTCKRETLGVKTEGIWTLPLYLVIHLKRFQYTSFSADETKVATMLRFPERGLDLGPYLANTDHKEGAACYDLVAVTNHNGPKSSTGHYTAFVRHAEDGCWYYHDDETVSRAQAEEVQTRSAYLLFYKQRCGQDLKFSAPKGGVSEPEIPAPPEPPQRPPKDPFLHPLGMLRIAPRPANSSDDASRPAAPVNDTPHAPSDIDAPYRMWRDFDIDFDSLK